MLRLNTVISYPKTNITRELPTVTSSAFSSLKKKRSTSVPAAPPLDTTATQEIHLQVDDISWMSLRLRPRAEGAQFEFRHQYLHHSGGGEKSAWLTLTAEQWH